MSHYKPYSAYRDSGVEWLGWVPEHWECARFDAKTTTHRDSIEADRLNGMRVLHYSIPAVQAFGCAQEEEGSEIDSNKLVVRQRQLLVSKLNPHKQTLVVADSSDSLLAIASTEFVPLIPVSADLGYITYVWSSAYCQHYLLARCESSTRSHQRVAPSDITRMSWVWPGLEEQAAIVRALDRETGRIDALIEKKARFIELLREKRQALITHAVTKGLNPNVKMKDSGVEWLGAVPEHWSVKQLKHVVDPNSSITYGIVQAGPEYAGGVPYIRTSDMSSDELPVSGYPLTSPEIDESYARSRVRPGDIVMSIRASVGKCLPVPDELSLANLTQGTAKVSPGQNVTRDFLLAFLNSGAAQVYFDLMAKGATFKEITLDALRRTPVLLPPREEQAEIDRFIALRVGRLSQLVRLSERSIDLLKERRAALITAAVTGQIDLREAL